MENVIEAKIVAFDGKFITLAPLEPLERELVQKEVQTVELRLNDGRRISASQRRKIFALIRDIALWSGDDPEYIRAFMTWQYCCKHEIEVFSLSDCDMTTAREFIDFLIKFCFEWDVPTKDTLLHQTDDISKYLYMCLEHRKCAICNARAEVHHVDRIGIGADREKKVHVGLLAIALCHEHHMEAHNHELELFEKYYVYGIRLDKYLCGRLRLNTKERRLNG